MSKDHVAISRVLSHALRHEPWVYELELDDEGWTSVDAVVAALRQESPAWGSLGAADLAEVIGSSTKQRHEIVGSRIRAIYGHSLPGKLQKTAAQPPRVLLHGTAPETAVKIRASGLLPMGRQYVHLSVERSMAVSVGKRKAANPTILVVRAEEAWKRGVAFYVGNESVWLADRVPAEFIGEEEGG